MPAVGFAVVVIAAGIWMVDRGVFRGQPELPGGVPTVAGRGQPISGEVQYMIDDYTGPVSIARNDETSKRDSEIDSLEQPRTQQDIRRRVRPVSF